MSQGKYYDGRSPLTNSVEIRIDGTTLRISRGDAIFGRWPLSQIFRDPTSSVTVLIGCGSQEDRLEIEDEALIKSLEPYLDTKVWGHRDLGSIKRYAVPLVVLLIGVIGFGLWHSRVLTKYLAMKVPASMEEKFLGFVENQSTEDRCTLPLEAQKSLDKIVTRLFVSDPENMKRVHVSIRKPLVQNAFTLPGGAIWMYRGLLSEMETSEELAGVLAHEIEHVLQRHILEAMIRATLFTGLLNAFAGDVSGFVLIDPATAAQLMGLRLSRDVENEADIKALERLKAAKISTTGMSRFFARLEKKGKVPDSLSFLNTHPSSNERVKLFERDQDVKTDPELLTKDEWDGLRSSCN